MYEIFWMIHVMYVLNIHMQYLLVINFSKIAHGVLTLPLVHACVLIVVSFNINTKYTKLNVL